MRKLYPLLPTLVALLGISLAGCPGGTTCGDGHIDEGEECDDGNTVDGDGCSSACKTESSAAVCGNGKVETGEECDDGNKTSGDGCSATCLHEAGTCGNGKVEAGEECDDGNTTAGDGCSATCTTEPGGPKCGNNKVETGETCDDGNTTNGDGCSANCQTEAVCGNGKVEPGEQCDDSNTTSGDGCSATCQNEGATEVVCQTLTAGPCTVTGTGGGKLLVGTVLAPDKIYRGGQVVLDAAGKILFVGCKADCDNDATCAAAAGSATAITCPSGVISPGLINTHDHITYTNTGPQPTNERYEHRHEWRENGVCSHNKIPVPGKASDSQVLWGELRFLFGGATSTVGSISQTKPAGLLRNLDSTTYSQGLPQSEVADFDTFPLNDITPTSAMLTAECKTTPLACSAYSGVRTEAQIAAEPSYLPHVAEGINAFAENEFLCLSAANPGHDLVKANSAFIHGVGLKPADYATMAQAHTSLIWSPRSNISLYGDTAIVTEASRLGVRIALGTDWLASGSMNMLRELRCADSLNQKYYDKFFSDHDLWAMATGNAAGVLAMDDYIGRLEAGKLGDIAIFDGTTHKDYRAIIDADPQDVQLVLRAGTVLYGDKAVVSAIPNAGACDDIDACSSPKQVCLQGDLKMSYSQLQTAAGNIYGAIFCSTPTSEPSCTPTRPASVNGSTIYTGAITPDDSDGDGIPDATDNCPKVFNPIRPMDNGVQADADGDGVGDACDPCPLDANTTTCTTTVDPNDIDGDGVPNASDNCPTVANADQADADKDGKGDACDPCPNQANPGATACTATIYQIKNGTIPLTSQVALFGQLVTGRTAKGYYLQVKNGDPDWNGSADYSGIYVFDTANTVKVGDRINVTAATVTDFHGQIELTAPTAVVVTSLGEATPPPVVATPAELTTLGTRAAKLESVIVQVNNVSATDINPALNPTGGDTAPTNEFIVDGALRVNDALYLITPFPTLGQSFTSLTGILDYRNGDSKLELRSAADVVLGTPSLIGFGPALTYIDAGQSNATTFPTALTVTLTNAPTVATDVTITSGDATSLTVVGGKVTIPAGQTTAQVFVNGLAQSAGVTLTATLGTNSLTAHVRVLGPTEQPSIVSLTPAAPLATPGSTVTFTVTLDIPAALGGTSVALALNPTNGGTLPATVLVPVNQLSATFDYVDGSGSNASITATAGASTASATITIVANLCQTTHLVISEIRSRGPAGAADEFVELYNPTTSPVTLDATWKLEARSNATGSYSARWAGSGKVIPAHGHFLIAGTGYVQSPAADEALTTGVTDATSLRLVHSSATVDAVCYGFDATSTAVYTTDATYTCEGTPVSNNPHNNSGSGDGSVERLPGGSAGNCTDTGVNSADFAVRTVANPQSTQSPATP
jgi:cysteine-rich repeat protein